MSFLCAGQGDAGYVQDIFGGAGQAGPVSGLKRSCCLRIPGLDCSLQYGARIQHFSLARWNDEGCGSLARFDNRRKFRSQTSDNMDRWKSRGGKSQRREEQKREDQGRERVRRKKMQVRAKSWNTVFFQWFVAPEGRKVGSLKQRVRSHVARWEVKICAPLWREAHLEVKMYKPHQSRSIFGRWDVMSKNCTPLWRDAHLEVKMYKPHHARSTFGRWDVEKLHAVVARSTFGGQNVQATSESEHFWTLRCRKIARRGGAKHLWKSKCTNHTMLGALLDVEMSKKIARSGGAKHIWKSKCTNHTMLGALLDVEMSKNCTPFWREAHLEVKMYKPHQHRSTFGSCDVEKAHTGAARISKSKCAKHTNVGPLLEVEMSKKCTPLWREAHLEAHLEIKMYTTTIYHTSVGALLDVEVSKKCTPLWREAHLEVKMHKPHTRQSTFGRWDVEKLHAVVARSTFGSQNVQTTPASEDLWTLRCGKSARRGGAKHIWKSRCTNHTSVGAFLEVVMSKKRTPWRREAHFQVKMYKAHQRRTTFGRWDVEKVHAVVARSTFWKHIWKSKCATTLASEHFWTLRCRKSACRCGAKHLWKSKCTNHTSVGALLEVVMSKKRTPLWREAHFQVKMYKAHQGPNTFGSWDVEKVHVVVARSTFPNFPSQKCKKLTGTEHFSTFRSFFFGGWRKILKSEQNVRVF